MSDQSPRSTLVLTVLLTLFGTLSCVFGYLYFTRPRDIPVSQPIIKEVPATPFAEAALLQKDTVSPRGNFTGIVYYPVPYASPPNLKLTSTNRAYDILEQDGSGFTWMARFLPDDFKLPEYSRDSTVLQSKITRVLESSLLKPDLVLEDFHWEARGVRSFGTANRPKKLDQKGSFTCPVGEQGVEFFPIPFDSPPHVELITTLRTVVIVDCTEKSFKWKNSGNHPSEYGVIQWAARGIKTGEVGK